jgi:hypothetical protein
MTTDETTVIIKTVFGFSGKAHVDFNLPLN